MIKILDDLVNPTYADCLEHEAKSVLYYRYNEYTSYPTRNGKLFLNEFPNTNITDNGQFVCTIVDIDNNDCPQQSYFNFLRPLIFAAQHRVPEVNFGNIIRCKANILTQQKNSNLNYHNLPHFDYASENSYSLLYYINDSDGDTFMFNEHQNLVDLNNKPKSLTIHQKIHPKKNRAILFKSSRYHASSSPVLSKSRMVFNFVFTND